MNFELFLVFAGIVFIIALIPGPNSLLVLFTALSDNKKNAFANVAGVGVGFIVHAFISALGLSIIIAQSVMAFTIIKWIGVLYLLWLGYSHIKAAIQYKNQLLLHNKQTNGIFKNFNKGLLTNLLNPKIVLFYLSIFPQFVNQNEVLKESLLLGLTQAFVVMSWFIVIILLAQYFKNFLTNHKNIKWLNYLSGCIFIIFSIKLAKERL